MPDEEKTEIDAENTDTTEESEGNEDDEEVGGSKKKKIIIIIIILLVVLGGAGAGLHFAGLLPGGGAEKEDEHNVEKKLIYYDLEEFLVNLNNPNRQVSFLKMKVTLELPDMETKKEVESKRPRIRDSFQVYLRELRNSDLQGSAGILRLKEELLLRINKTIDPQKVNDILFKEIIVQ